MNTYQNKSIARLCRLGYDDVLVMVNMHSEVKDVLQLSAEAKGLTLSEECYLRLCASIDTPSTDTFKTNCTLDELIFNENIAIDEKQLGGR